MEKDKSKEKTNKNRRETERNKLEKIIKAYKEIEKSEIKRQSERKRDEGGRLGGEKQMKKVEKDRRDWGLLEYQKWLIVCFCSSHFCLFSL